MAVIKLTTTLLCLCMIQGSSGFFTALFGPNGMFGGRGFPFAPQFGASQSTANESPSVCQKKACVPYTVISKTPDYEHRRYEVMSVAYTTQTKPGFLGKISLSSRLSGYVTKGKNEDNLVMNMTYPILTPVTNVSTMIFILPVSNPPAPISPKVSVDTMPAMEVYVKPFTGNAMSHKAAAKAFRDSLAVAGIVTTNEAYVADYHTMFSMFNRRSELWVVGSYLIRGEEPAGAAPLQLQPQQQNGLLL